MDAPAIHLAFESGTLLVAGATPDRLLQLPGVRFDPRTNAYRAEGRHYRAIVEQLRANHAPYADEVRTYQQTPWPLRIEREAFPHQTESVEAWWRQRGRGVVVLPTGTGKTHVAILAIAKAARPALVVTPTIDLLNQWYAELSDAFRVPIGLMGGGHHDLRPLTVTTYDSAYIYVEKWGNRFGLLV